MDNLVTIKTFNYPHEAMVLQSRLESEGIPCFLKDAVLTQVHPWYSNAIGGVKLQIRESDVGRAIEILAEAGYGVDQDNHSERLYNWFEKLKIILVSRKLWSGLAGCAALIISLVHLLSPGTYDKLTQNNWCLDYITYGGKAYKPMTPGLHVTVEGLGFEYCNERIFFNDNGNIRLPGFNSRRFSGKWELNDDNLTISGVDTFQHIFNGNYIIDIDGSELILTSDNTVIYCSAQ